MMLKILPILFIFFFACEKDATNSNNITSTCGNGVREGEEECDIVDLNGLSCEILGFYPGELSCTQDCRINSSNCPDEIIPGCGNGIIELEEECDLEDFGSKSCQEAGFDHGELICTEGCSIDYSACQSSTACGNGIVEVELGEECDRESLNGNTCQLLGYHSGAIDCKSDCTLDLSDCISSGQCGDGSIQDIYETCDGTNLGSENCEGVGYYGGTLTCDSNCTFNYFGCEAFGRCGDGLVQSEFEICDGEVAEGTTCHALGFFQGDLACGANCQPVGCSGIFKISSGNGHTCLISEQRYLYCWGMNGGQIGDGTQDDRNVPTLVQSLPGVTFAHVGPGGGATCAVDSLGALWCWGSNELGQLGNGTTVSSTTPVTVTGVSGRTFIKAYTAYRHSCAVENTGKTWCWGLNYFGQLGNGSTTDSTVPVAVSLSTSAVITEMALGEHHTCAVAQNGLAYCWGVNYAGQLGNGTTVDSSIPVLVQKPSNIILNQVAAGWSHSCAKDNSGAIWCWGDNASGQLGTGDTNDRNVPIMLPLPNGATYQEVSAKHFNTCALDSLGIGWCWGSNGYGQIGDGTTTGRLVPTQVIMPIGVTFIKFTAGMDHTCGVSSLGGVWCWGRGTDGQLGTGQNLSSITPVRVIEPN